MIWGFEKSVFGGPSKNNKNGKINKKKKGVKNKINYCSNRRLSISS